MILKTPPVRKPLSVEEPRRPLNLGRDVGPSWVMRTLEPKTLSRSQAERARMIPSPPPPGFHRSGSQAGELPGGAVPGAQQLPAAGAHTFSPTCLHPTPAARGPRSPLRRLQPRRRTTTATAATEIPRAAAWLCTQPPWQRDASGGSGSAEVVAEMKSASSVEIRVRSGQNRENGRWDC